ncbi:MAG: hypothetical protein AB1634_14600 [Thermodesulfobacteriota bacterium]
MALPPSARRPPAASRRSERLVVVAAAGALLLNYPLLALFSKPGLVWGVPTLYLYIFVVWALVIGLIALVVDRPAGRARKIGTGGEV